MSKTRREIECLARLQTLVGTLDNIIEFLLAEALLKADQVRDLRRSPEIAKDLQIILSRLQTDGKLQLLEYTWNILPVEQIKVHIITDRMNQEFNYNF